MKQNDWLQLEDCPPSLLRTLVAFADQGSVSKAAAALDLEQPVVSRRLRVFIDSQNSGEGLLERVGPRRLRFTERGTGVLPRVREVLSRYEDLLAHLRGAQRAQEVVRVALGNFAAQLYLPQVVAEARRQELWRLDARLVRGRDRIVGVAEGRFDLALVTHDAEEVADLLAGRELLATDRVARHQVVVIAHPATQPGQELLALPTEQAVPPERLARWPLVGLDEQSGLCKKLQRQLRGRGSLKLTQECQPGGWALGREYARHRLGVALLPQPLLTEQDRKDFVVRRVSSTFAIEVVLVMRHGTMSQAQTDAAELFRQTARQLVRGSRRDETGGEPGG